MFNISFLSLGSNLGNRLKNLENALELIKNDDKVNINKSSDVYETSPMYYYNQNNFYNCVIKIETSLSAIKLLEFCQNIEKKLLKVKDNKKNRPRVIDIDIITYNNLKLLTKALTIPHPLVYERKFVLVPFLDIEPEYKFISNTKTIKQLIDSINDKSNIIKLKYNLL